MEIRERAAGRSTLAGRNCLGVLQGAAIVHTENLLEDAVQVVNGIEFRAEVGGQLCPRELQRIALNDLRNQVGRFERIRRKSPSIQDRLFQGTGREN